MLTYFNTSHFYRQIHQRVVPALVEPFVKKRVQIDCAIEVTLETHQYPLLSL